MTHFTSPRETHLRVSVGTIRDIMAEHGNTERMADLEQSADLTPWCRDTDYVTLPGHYADLFPVTTIHQDYDTVAARFRDEIDGLVDSALSDVYWDRASGDESDTVHAYAMALATSDTVQDLCLSLAFESLRGSMSDFYGFTGGDLENALGVASVRLTAILAHSVREYMLSVTA